ncbi:hypothetical protein BJ170DRAFT_210705 [Xylariales sp. AK1849]|nr:hypothetical protein BJ170DRAFT_210705 [Xylariales sp. AK1849]
MSFNPTPRKPGAASVQHSSTTPASSRFRSSLVPMHRVSPARASQSSSKLATSSGTARDLFRVTTPKPTRVTQFAPNLPTSATKAPASIRKFAPKGTGAGMAATTSSELFKMRIPSPDPDLTGEALAKAVPDDLNRKGTVYADQYLKDKCPREFDDDQRRQFYCILDLRRLKFAANEIFAKKDWKLNIINFAKEYEKSRSLIMLRYGLYEFKNVKPSEEVMKNWRKAHGLPAPEPKPEKAIDNTTAQTPFGASTSTSKRKADDDFQPKDNTLKASTVNQNKRRNLDQELTDDVPRFAPAPLKGKRKADEAEEPDENQRNKLQKATPSAARSRLEGIINNVQSGTSTPAGSPLKRPLFGASTSSATAGPTTSLFGVPKSGEGQTSAFAMNSNPYGPPSNGVTNTSSSKLQSSMFQPGQTLNGAGAGSILSGHKIGSTPAAKSTNIFGYLSESSANNSGAENGNDDADTDSGSEHESEPETGSQDNVASLEASAAASAGTATPPIAGGSSLFSFSKPASATSNPFASAFNKPAEKPAEEPAKESVNNAAKGGLFGRVSLGSDGQPLRGASIEPTPKAPSLAKEPAPEPETEQTKTPAKPPGDYTFNPATTPINFSHGGSSIFGAKPSATPAQDDTAKESKESVKAPAPSTSAASIFGSNPLAKSTTTEQPSQTLFGAKPSTQLDSTPQQPSSKPLFGGFNQAPKAERAAETPAASSFSNTQKPASTSAFSFGTSAQNPASGETHKVKEPDTTAAAKEQPNNLFGSELFGTPNTTNGALASAAEEKPKNAFGSQPTFSFGSSKPAATPSTPAATALFGNYNKPATESQQPALGGSQSIFGNNNTSSVANTFGAPAANPFPASNSSMSAKRGFADENSQSSKKTVFGRSEAGDSSGSQQSSAPTFGADSAMETDNSPKKNSMFSDGTQSAMHMDNSTEKKSMFSGIAGGSGPTSPVPGRRILTPKRMRGHTPQPAQNNAPPAQSSFGGSAMFGSQNSDVPATNNVFGNNNNNTSATTPSFSFGSNAAAEMKPDSSSSFSFGAQNNGSGANQNAAPFSFGGSTPQTNGAGTGNSNFNFTGGSTTPSGGSFNFGAGNQDSSSNQGSFTFGAGGAGQSNPFGGSNGQANQSFGGNSATPTPSGSFNFQFGGQGPSTPNPAPPEQTKAMFGGQTNGSATAPSFNFTSATPPQNTPNAFAQKPAGSSMFSNLLQPGGGNGTSSPFPAPSSINTTPVNGGTPEPQPQPQQEDGEAEAPQEQISLIQGGPGEEDEECLHEVRAKATKYIPVEKGSEDEAKSPWQTQGVGPLRVLKNKSTGSVRILLRAEPRGHIAMNKTVLAGIDYKADGKYLKFMAARDDGNGLETWMLQVKKPESATELAAVMEANKAANK